MGIKDAFSVYGAALKNVNWSVSAENGSGELIVSLWSHCFTKPENGRIKYVDCVSRWSGHGNKEFRERIAHAFKMQQIVRPVIANTNDEAAVRRGEDASKLKNTFHARPNWQGKVSVWDGDNFEIEFVDSSRSV